MVTSAMKTQPDDETKEFFYFEAVEGQGGIAEDINHYDRLDENSGGDRSFEYLFESVNRCIKQEKRRAMQEALVSP